MGRVVDQETEIESGALVAVGAPLVQIRIIADHETVRRRLHVGNDRDDRKRPRARAVYLRNVALDGKIAPDGPTVTIGHGAADDGASLNGLQRSKLLRRDTQLWRYGDQPLVRHQDVEPVLLVLVIAEYRCAVGDARYAVQPRDLIHIG